MRGRRAVRDRALGLAAGASIVFAAFVGGETPRGVSTPSAGARLVPGTAVAVEWALPDEVGAFDEMELLLSLDRGATYTLRVTREISPAARSLLWRVPQLPAAGARLALRVGSRGRRVERVVATSAEFSIEGEPSAPAEELFPDGGEWRPRDALEGDPPPSPPIDLKPRSSIRDPTEDSDAIGGSRAPALEPLRLRLSRGARSEAARRALASSLFACGLGAPLPLRE